MIVVTVDHPVDIEQSHRSIGKYILTQLPSLDRYVSIHKHIRVGDPLCYVNIPQIVDKPTPPQNNPFQALANTDDTISVSEMEHIDVFTDSDDDTAGNNDDNSTTNSTENG